MLVAMFEVDGEAAVMLTKRPETMPSHQGEIAFPGGKREPGATPTSRAAALREAQEEVGLDPARSRSSPSSTSSAPSRRAFTITPFVGLLDRVPELRARPARGGATRSRSRSRSCSHPGVHRAETWDLCGAIRPTSMAFFELPGETVWGATARILPVSWRHLVGDG